jgi:aspartate racemase
MIGILGGMGPLASAEFLKTIYEFSQDEREQEAPRVTMYSDPSFPDRTEEYLKGSFEILRGRLVAGLRRLQRLGAAKSIICCVTAHYWLPKLPGDLGSRVISLLDVVFDSVLHSHKRYLLICSRGTQKMQLFQTHPRWSIARDRIALPSDSDQEQIHDLIYRQIKQNRSLPGLVPVFQSIVAKYGADSYIAGCTEMHLLSRHCAGRAGVREENGCIDPLTILAKKIAKREI